MGFDLSSLLNLYRAYLSYTGKKNVRADITLLLEGGDNVTFPVPPDNLPRITTPQNNDTFNSVIGDVSIMGLLGLRSVEFEDFLLPSVTYLNMAVLIDDFDYYMDNQADYHMNAKFTEYRTYNSQTGGLET